MNSTLTLDAVLFDLDGTLYDSGWLDEASLKRLVRKDLGWGEDDLHPEDYLGVSSRELLEEIAPQRVEELLGVWLEYQNELRPRSSLFPGVRDLLADLNSAGYKLGIVTSQNGRELAATREHLQIDPHFEVWVSASDTRYPKPHPGPVEKALDMMGVAPQKAVMVGDNLTDLKAGRASGTQVGAALWGAKDVEALRSFEPEFVFREVTELYRLLDE